VSTILIAEDDPQVSALLARGLRSSGFDVSLVGNGDAALTAAREAPPDLMILDLGLPGRAGLDVLKELLAEGRDDDAEHEQHRCADDRVSSVRFHYTAP